MKLIFSADENWGIGRDNGLLFRAKGDMARFKTMTTGRVVIMGRATLESLPGSKPLKDRVNIVLTSDRSYRAEDALVCGSVEELLIAVKDYPEDDLFVIGGESLYRQLLPYCDTAYITRFLAAAPADRFMPDFDALPEWKLWSRSEEFCEDGLRYRFDVYVSDIKKRES